jgi:hypothetical protein
MKIFQLIRGVIGGGLFLAVALSAAESPVNGVLLDQGQLENVNFKFVEAFGFSTVVILSQAEGRGAVGLQKSISEIKDAGLNTALWIEVARDPELAAAHPEWMASLQGHPEWRRFYPDFPELKEGEVVKVFPWVPISYEEAFAAQLKKVYRVLERWPKIQQVFLNDIQAAPSACGCGHPLCRWTADYGPIKTATPMGPNFAARFIQAVRALRDGLEVIPVWATECEEGDKPGLCAGVGCFNGACWRDWTAQLEPLASESHRIGALLLKETFQRTDSDVKPTEGWLSQIPKMFTSMPEKHKHPAIGPERLIAVIEGWSPSMQASLGGQLAQLRSAGVHSFVVAQTKIDQSWEPRVIEVP